jgi:arylsulfatase
MPTLLELIGIDPPTEINGVSQRPIEGVSFAHTLWSPEEPSHHTTQYYEMLGSRAMYHDGWKAVVFRPLAFVRYTADDDPFRSFEDDDWELYHVAADFSETRDLAAEHPDKLAELVDIWWQEAERYNVLPVTNMPITGSDPRYRRRRYVFYPGIGTIPQLVAPNVSNRAWSLRAELVVPEDGAHGALVCHGSHAGGYVAFLRDGRLHFVYNHLGTTLTTTVAEVILPLGPVEVRLEFTPTGAHAGDVNLFYGDVPVGQGHIPRTTLVTVGVHGFTVGYQRGSAISPDFAGRNDVTPGALRRVVIETFSAAQRTPPTEDRVGLASQ